MYMVKQMHTLAHTHIFFFCIFFMIMIVVMNMQSHICPWNNASCAIINWGNNIQTRTWICLPPFHMGVPCKDVRRSNDKWKQLKQFPRHRFHLQLYPLSSQLSSSNRTPCGWTLAAVGFHPSVLLRIVACPCRKLPSMVKAEVSVRTEMNSSQETRTCSLQQTMTSSDPSRTRMISDDFNFQKHALILNTNCWNKTSPLQWLPSFVQDS